MTEQTTIEPSFPRTGEIHFSDTHVAIWEEWENQPGDTCEAKEARRQVHFRGVEAAFEKLVEHLRSRGFKVGPDRSIFKSCGVVGRKGDLEFDAHVGGRQAEFNFFQNVANVENQNGGRHDFDKFKRMPRDLRLRCAVEMIRLIRAMQGLGYTFGPKSDLSEPLDRAVIRKAERRTEEGLSPLERFNRGWGADRFKRGPDGWPTDDEIGSHNRKDKDGALLSNGDTRYFRHHCGRVFRGQVFTDINGMWTVVGPDGQWLSKVGSGELFSTDRPDLLPRRIKGREPQVSRVAHELGKARHLRDRVLAHPRARLKVKLPPVLAWLTPILWPAMVVSSQDRVAVLERVVTRMSAGERGYYTWSIKDQEGKKSILFFAPNANGYAVSVHYAGRFLESQVSKHQSYYDNEETTIAVPCEAVDALMDADGCVPNTAANRHALRAAAGKARGARGQSSVKIVREAERRARKASSAVRREVA
jgi:hypothetical protein